MPDAGFPLPSGVRLLDVVLVSRAVAESSRRLDKIAQLAALLARTPPDEVDVVVAFLSGCVRQGRIGIGVRAIRAARDVTPAPEAVLALADVDRTLTQIAATGGAGAATARPALLRQLLSRATPAEQDFLVRLLFGELRQGALERVLIDAVAKAAQVPVDRLRRAVMMAGALPIVASAVLKQGDAALDGFLLTLMRPIQPMLADSAADVGAALAGHAGEAAVEYKIDGARIQVHKDGEHVRVFSRALNDVTSAVPEVIDLVRALPAHSAVLDGEAVALRADGMPQPFQVTMRRFGRRLDVERLRTELPLAPFFFDCLYVDGGSLIDDPLARRVAVLDRLVPAAAVVPRTVAADPDAAARFAGQALDSGHEGVMVKRLDAPYTAGRRGSAWVKVKPAHTLDLVVLAAEWGSGRRHGFLSNLHLAARDTERGGFVMLGKTFKGLTDELLAWQTGECLAREVGRDAYTVYVKPELVVEIAFNDIQASPQYPGRLALRFARVRRYRSDKTAAEADTFQALQVMYRQMTGAEPPAR